VGIVFLLCWAELPGEEGEGLPDALHSLLEDGTNGGGCSVRDQGEWSGWIQMNQKSSSRQTRFTVIESCDEYFGPGDGMGVLSFGAGKDVVKKGLN
jgi:hypothetical protein